MTIHTQPKPNGTPTWLDLTAPDLDAARTFYHAVFGWEYDIGGPEYLGYTTALVGGKPVAGLGVPAPGTSVEHAEWGLLFASDRIETHIEQAVAAGATSLVPPMHIAPFGTMAICIDPTGATFGFWQAGENIGSQLNDEVGAAAWYELHTPDPHKASGFYASLMGATAGPMPDVPGYHLLMHGEQMIAGIGEIAPVLGTTRAQWLPYFLVANADDTVATVAANGGQTIGTIEPGPYGRFVALHDPQGGVFYVIENQEQ